MRSTPEDEPPDPQQLRLDRMLESEVSFIVMVYYFCITVKLSSAVFISGNLYYENSLY